MSGAPLGWLGVVRLGLVQASLGAVIVLMTSTLNRVMIVELALAAAVPGALVALHFVVQFWARPRMGHVSDRARRRTPIILAGMLMAALGALAATLTTVAMDAAALSAPAAVAALAAAFILLGIGAGTAGTPLLALLADRVAPARRGRAIGLVWVMMIAGFIVTTVLVGKAIEPFTMERLAFAAAGVCGAALVVTALALLGLETGSEPRAATTAAAPAAPSYRDALHTAWTDRAVRRFALFILVSMLGYSAQDLILEPFTGSVFGLTPGQSTRITSVHQGGMLVGMVAAALLSARWGSLRHWAAAGCVASAVAFALLALTPGTGSIAALRWTIGGLGIANGVFAIGALGSMMAEARGDGAGLRMGIFGAAQAVAYAVGAFAGAVLSDLGRAALGSDARGYAMVFAVEAFLFLAAAILVTNLGTTAPARLDLTADPDALAASLS